MNVEELVDHIIECADSRQRFIVAIAGPPGSGKSTLAKQLYEALKEKAVRARVIPLDGFHLDNSILSNRGILARKGAAATFDVAGFANLMMRLSNSENDVVIPVFDRERDVAIAGADVVSATDTVLIVEGNYLLLRDSPWNKFQEFWDETIFINPGLEVLQERLIDRWLEHGLDPERARTRAQCNDIPNARYVIENSSPPSIQV